MSGTTRIERRGHVAVLTLDRPERRNALNEAMWSSLAASVAEIARDLPRALVVTGAGDRAFSAGMDVKPDNPQVPRLLTAIQSADRPAIEAFLRGVRGAIDALVALPIPVIAAVNGLAYGGGAELAARCDLRVADPAARICFSEVRLGLMPDLGGGPALARLVGPAKAARLVLAAQEIDAAEALALGLVDRVSAPGAALAEAVALGAQIAANGPRAVRSALEIIRRSGEMPLSAALDLELERAIDLILSGECRQGIPAFIAGRPPAFEDPPA